jgi:hypothetical protein
MEGDLFERRRWFQPLKGDDECHQHVYADMGIPRYNRCSTHGWVVSSWTCSRAPRLVSLQMVRATRCHDGS